MSDDVSLLCFLEESGLESTMFDLPKCLSRVLGLQAE